MTRRERLLARSLAFVAGVHAAAGLVVFQTSGRWVSNDSEAGLMLVLMLWSLMLVGFTAAAIATLIQGREQR